VLSGLMCVGKMKKFKINQGMETLRTKMLKVIFKDFQSKFLD
jgi:hypothetical protein